MTARRDPTEMQIANEDLKVRMSARQSRTANVLLDRSYSMHGNKFLGALMSVVAPREIFLKKLSTDVLHIVSYKEISRLVKYGQALSIIPQGKTDIARAIEMGIQLLSREEGIKNIFLITDDEPTISCDKNLSPEESAYKAGSKSHNENIGLHIIMLNFAKDLSGYLGTNGDTKWKFINN